MRLHSRSTEASADLVQVNRILDVFQAHGHKEIDSSRLYCSGTAEKYLAKAHWEKRGLVLETKLLVIQLHTVMDMLTLDGVDIPTYLEKTESLFITHPKYVAVA